MLAENPALTTKRFISSWRSLNVDPNRLAEELLSVSDETNRRLNDFQLIVKDGELVDPATSKVIDFQRTTELEKKEGKVWDTLKAWASNSEEGSAVWTSPQLEGVYPCDKVAYYQIAYTFGFPPQKVLVSTAILLDGPKGKFSEDFRDKLIIKDPGFNLTDLLEELGQKENEKSHTPSQEKINYFVNKIKNGDDANSIVAEMQSAGELGSHSLSCPTSSSGALISRARILN